MLAHPTGLWLEGPEFAFRTRLPRVGPGRYPPFAVPGRAKQAANGVGTWLRRTIAHILETAAEAHPDRVLFSFYGGNGALRETYTYGGFFRRTNFVARRLRDMGVSSGCVALLVYPPGIEMAIAFFACARVGAIPAPAPPPTQSRGNAGWLRLAHIARHAGSEHVLTTSDVARWATERQRDSTEAPVPPLAGLRWIATDTLRGELDSLAESPSDILFVQYTSGSTSAPRGVAVTHENVIHNASLCVDHDRPIGVTWLPHFHDMGLLGYFLFSLVKDGEAHCFSPLDFIRRPILWFELISRKRATITTAPNAAYEYCLRDDKIADAQLEGIDLGSLRTMVNCAEQVRPNTFERFWRRYAGHGLRKSAYVAGYGLAEHTLCVTTGGRRIIEGGVGEPAPNGKSRPGRFVSCGRWPDDVDLRIVDPESHRPVAESAVGEIWVDSPSKAAGYWRQPELTVESVQAQVAGEPAGNGYLRTGDLGFIRDGELFVCGRLRDMLVLNGRNVFPGDVEALLEESFQKLLAGRVAAFGLHDGDAGTEHLVVLVEAGADAVNLKRLRGLVQDGCDVSVGTIARVPRGTIVHTSSGKVARQHCREKWEDGSVEVLEIVVSGDERASAGGVEMLIGELVAQAEALGEPDATLDRLGLDSIALVDLSLALEDRLEQEGLALPELTEHVSDLSLLQALRISDLRAALALLGAGRSDAEVILGMFGSAAHEVRRDERERMRADAKLPLPKPAFASGDGRGAFVTGATGFLGAHLVRSLLELTDEPVTVLVRCNDPAHGVARLRRALLDTDMAPGAVTKAIASRIHVLAGDLALAHFGLSDRDWAALSGGIGRIYHCGAEVDYVKSYNLLRPANVLATREVVGLASEGCRKSLHYVSTTFVFGWSVKPFLFESDDVGAAEELDFGYAQSKWVAEQLVLRAARGGLAATISRPALVTASASGRFVQRDITVRVLGYMIRHGLTVDAPNQVSFLPVDVCARNIIAMSLEPVQTAPILHLTADDYYTIFDVCKIIAGRFGYRFRTTGLKEFVAHAHAHCAPDDALYPLLSFLDRNTKRFLRMGNKRYDSTQYRRVRNQAPLAVQHPDLAATVEAVVNYLIDEGLVPPAPATVADGATAAAHRVAWTPAVRS